MKKQLTHNNKYKTTVRILALALIVCAMLSLAACRKSEPVTPVLTLSNANASFLSGSVPAQSSQNSTDAVLPADIYITGAAVYSDEEFSFTAVLMVYTGTDENTNNAIYNAQLSVETGIPGYPTVQQAFSRKYIEFNDIPYEWLDRSPIEIIGYDNGYLIYSQRSLHRSSSTLAAFYDGKNLISVETSDFQIEIESTGGAEFEVNAFGNTFSVTVDTAAYLNLYGFEFSADNTDNLKYPGEADFSLKDGLWHLRAVYAIGDGSMSNVELIAEFVFNPDTLRFEAAGSDLAALDNTLTVTG